MEVHKLCRRVAALDEELRTLRALREAETSKKRRAVQSEARRDARLQLRGTLLLALTAPDLLPLRAFAERREVSPEVLDVFLEKVVSRYLAMSEHDINEMLWPSTAAGQEQLMIARRFLVEYDVHTWIGAENESKGLAPGIAEVLCRRNELGELQQQCEHSARMYGSSHTASYRWARRFRARWRLRNVQPSQHELEPLGISREKVLALSCRPVFLQASSGVEVGRHPTPTQG